MDALPLHYQFDLVRSILEEILCVLVPQVPCIVVVDLRYDISSHQVPACWCAGGHLELLKVVINTSFLI